MADISQLRPGPSGDPSQRRGFAGSGLVTAGILVLALLIFGAYWQAHRRAAFHRLRTRETPAAPVVPMPGGQEPVTLTRLAMQDETVPGFVSAVLLPGVGMQFQQAAIALPGREGLSLFQGPSTIEAAAMAPANIQTAPIHLYVASTPFSTRENGATDLIGSAPATSVETETIPDGGQVSAKFPASPGPTPDVTATVTAVLNGHVLDLTVAAKNNATADRYLAFEWSPRFALLSPDLGSVTVTLPSRQLWKGGTQGAAPADLDFATPTGKHLGPKPFDVTLVDLHTEILADGPAVRIVDLRNGTLLRVTAFNPNVRTLQVQAEPGSHTLLLGFKSLDPTPDGNHGGDLLHPGQAAQWHARIEVLPVAPPARQASAASFE